MISVFSLCCYVYVVMLLLSRFVYMFTLETLQHNDLFMLFIMLQV